VSEADGPAALTDALRDLGTSLGFARFGVARAGRLEPEADQLRAFLSDGRHGDMAWLERTEAVRVDPRHEGMVPGAVSVAVFVAPYARPEPAVGPVPGRVARYARGRDYHNVLGRRMRKLETFLRERGYHARASVDSRPVMERAWAERAGVGFVGKNCCLIVPGLGSHVFLCCLVTTAALVPSTQAARHCGSCSLCLSACPTEAFVEARKIDARRCISYLTIEKAGPIEVTLRDRMGDWIFGCDVCQDVCPYNATSLAPLELTAPFAASDRFARVEATDLLSMDESTYDAWSEGSPLRRAGSEQMARNAAIVLANHGARSALPALREAATRHASETVREAAAWAIGRLEGGEGARRDQSSEGSSG